MTPERQRIVIAELCGWKWVSMPLIVTAGGCAGGIFVHVSGKQSKTIPDYLNDLNAMARTEEELTEKQRRIYAEILAEIVHPHYWAEVSYEAFEHYHATAAQRAEAFLRTLGKWEEDKS